MKYMSKQEIEKLLSMEMDVKKYLESKIESAHQEHNEKLASKYDMMLSSISEAEFIEKHPYETTFFDIAFSLRLVKLLKPTQGKLSEDKIVSIIIALDGHMRSYLDKEFSRDEIFKYFDMLKNPNYTLSQLKQPLYVGKETQKEVQSTNIEDEKKDESFIAISDFHAMNWPLEKVKKYYIQEYDKIFILGDATDRGEFGDGEGGIQLLQRIKDLSEKYPNKIIYIPGNHDVALYDYAKFKDQDAECMLFNNGGEETIDDIDYLKRTSPTTAQNLIDWLGKLPLQRVHKFQGQKYVLAHAFFNNELYKQNPNFSLETLHSIKEKYGKKSKIYNQILNIVWFRKGHDDYRVEELPGKDAIEVIGHTPLTTRKGYNLDLKRADGTTLKVHCVDGGVSFTGTMLKYDGKEKPALTERGIHEDTSQKKQIPSTVMTTKKSNFNHRDFDDFLEKVFSTPEDKDSDKKIHI